MIIGPRRLDIGLAAQQFGDMSGLFPNLVPALDQHRVPPYGRMNDEQVDICFGVCLPVRIILNLSDIEHLFHSLNELKICSSSLLEAEVANRVVLYEIFQGLLEKGECWLKIYTVGSEDYIRLFWKGGRRWIAPVVYHSLYNLF